LSSKLSEYSSKTLITMWMSDAVTIAAFSWLFDWKGHIHVFQVYFLILILVFYSAGVWTQGFMLARQVCYHWAILPVPMSFKFQLKMMLNFIFRLPDIIRYQQPKWKWKC
jgi:hypothetical protein